MVLAIYVQCVVALGLMGVVDGAGVAAAPGALGTFAGRLALLAGACMAVGDGCITVMTDRLGVGVAAPVIFTTNIVFGATLDFLVAEGEPGECRVAYFCLGLACAVAGIVANVLSTPRPEDGLAARRRIMAGGVGRVSAPTCAVGAAFQHGSAEEVRRCHGVKAR